LNNLQVTKALSTWVGTSEAIRLLNIKNRYNNIYHNHLSFPFYWIISTSIPLLLTRKRILGVRNIISRKNNQFYEWLAGLIDGDGSFLLSKKGYASLEITMDIRDEHALQIIKNVYGGSIKLRSGANALRYRLHHKSGLLSLISDINGNIRNSNRLIQLNKICIKYELNLIYPKPLTFNDAWLSGFFDADGTITINTTNNQLSISASQKTYELLEPLVKLYGGNIYIDNGKSQSFKWYISKKEEILKIINYFKVNPCRSAKIKRIHLINKFYELKDIKAHKALPGTLLYKSWHYFYNKWLKYDKE
jgi:LAGLIDADG endonuclease